MVSYCYVVMFLFTYYLCKFIVFYSIVFVILMHVIIFLGSKVLGVILVVKSIDSAETECLLWTVSKEILVLLCMLFCFYDCAIDWNYLY